MPPTGYWSLLYPLLLPACGAVSLPSVGLHAAAALGQRSAGAAGRDAERGRRSKLVLSADVSFRLGGEVGSPYAAVPARALDGSAAGLPGDAAIPCEHAALCAWEQSAAADALVQLDLGEAP